MKLKSIKGTKDILPGESFKWQYLESVIRDVMDVFQYKEIRTPIFEDTSLFTRGIGEETDIVGKEMYTFEDKGGSSLTLRPEMTAPVMRAFLQHSLREQSTLTKFFYIAPMFRQERPQAGRYRQFHQYGVECVGLENPACDTEVIALAAEVHRRLGINSILKINSVGDHTCRPVYREVLQRYLKGIFHLLTSESQGRVETNPLRVLDSKAEQDKAATRNAPSILDYLSVKASEHFETVLSLLREMGIPYEIDHRLVRGLDYYSMTAFEFASTLLGSQDALGGGGRYDGLSDQLGGKPTPAVGYASGLERMLIVLEKRGFEFPITSPLVYFIALDKASRRWCTKMSNDFRVAGISSETDYGEKSLKAQMREANRLLSKYVCIIGEHELKNEIATVKEMSTGAQYMLPFSDLLNYFHAV